MQVANNQLVGSVDTPRVTRRQGGGGWVRLANTTPLQVHCGHFAAANAFVNEFKVLKDQIGGCSGADGGWR